MRAVQKIQKHEDGHRKRVCEKLINNGHENLYDYETVELMLFLIFKRKDTKPLAKILIQKFKTIDGILNASKDELLSIDGIGESTFRSLQIIKAIVIATLKSKITKRNTIDCFDDVINYCKVNMKNLTAEEFRIIFLNGINEVISDEVVQRGSIDSVDIYPREIVKKCIEKGAKSFILVHNHPSGDPTPSPNDIYATKKIKSAAELFNINLFDHIIIGGDRYISFKNLLILK